MADECICTCCKDAEERLRCNLDSWSGCYCHLSPEAEWCSCDFCRMALGRRRLRLN